MKNRVIPNNQEVRLTDDSIIVSKTDVKGCLTYANRAFMQISGYKESEILGKQHNIVRHPDMPRAVFNLLWNDIKQGKECFAYVKNLCKNGDYYWVLANITPDYEAGRRVCGYFSVRRKPKPEALVSIIPLYQQMLAAEQATNTKNAIAAGTEVLTTHIQTRKQDYEAFILSL